MRDNYFNADNAMVPIFMNFSGLLTMLTCMSTLYLFDVSSLMLHAIDEFKLQSKSVHGNYIVNKTKLKQNRPSFTGHCNLEGITEKKEKHFQYFTTLFGILPSRFEFASYFRKNDVNKNWLEFSVFILPN